jgi:hypothetical protein
MPRPEQVVSKADPSQGYGGTAQLQRQAAGAPLRPPAQPPPPASTVQPVTGGQISVPDQSAPQGDISGGFDNLLFAPTDRPNEPITHGAPFGPGANFIPEPGEDDRTFMLRVAGQLQQQPSTPRVQQYIAAIQRGQ